MRASRCAGFTLIEILVTMAIISVLSVVIVFAATPGEAAQARTEARRLAALLELALGEARASGQSIAWSPSPDGYAFLRMSEDGEWQGFPADSAYRRRSLPAGVALDAVHLGAQPLRRGERIVIRPYGLGADIQATIAGGGTNITLRGGPLGRVRLDPGALLHGETPRLHAS